MLKVVSKRTNPRWVLVAMSNRPPTPPMETRFRATRQRDGHKAHLVALRCLRKIWRRDGIRCWQLFKACARSQARRSRDCSSARERRRPR
jgi:hypothetical protein